METRHIVGLSIVYLIGFVIAFFIVTHDDDELTPSERVASVFLWPIALCFTIIRGFIRLFIRTIKP